MKHSYEKNYSAISLVLFFRYIFHGLPHLLRNSVLNFSFSSEVMPAHLSCQSLQTKFYLVSLPGFQFIQDPIEYGTRTYDSNMDTYDHLVPEDLKQAATIVAAFVYNAHLGNSLERIPSRKRIK
jgi:hypothetical protein